MTATTVDSGKLDIGRVIQQTFGVLGRNFVVFFILSLILVGLPNLLAGLAKAPGAASAAPDLGAGLVWLLSIVTTNILQGTIVYGTVQDLSGGRASIGESLGTGLRAFLPLIGLGILMVIALFFGFLLLIVPGVMMACAWCVAAPSLVAERRGILDSFRRSAELTRNNRWRILGLFLVYAAFVLVASLLIGILVGVGGLVAGMNAQSPALLVANAIVTALMGMLGSAGAAVLYVELRQLREGRGPQWLSEIFA